MKLSKVHPPSLRSGATSGPQSEVQSDGGKPRPRFNFGHGTLGFRLRPSNFGDRDGVALVITLIMLAIITFMAVTFLVLSQRERSSVSTAMDQKTARNASDAGLARVSAELLTRIMLHTNFQDLDLMVSTNYINLQGLHGGSPTALSPTNVNYEYLNNPQYAAITDPQDREINIASLLYNPRPPVYVPVVTNGTPGSDFRYYLDLNRNGRYDPSGNWPVVVTDAAGKPWFMNTNGTLVSTNLPVPSANYLLTNYFVGDPDWIGVLERPEELHSADNRFIGRYAYIVIPAGKTLDVNYIHNRAKRPLVPTNEGFLRNQGVGTWEVNLAGFLADLNTNVWWNPLPNPGPGPGYVYNQNNTALSTGLAFINANDFLNYRYGGTYLNLYPARAVLASSTPGALAAALAAYNIDVYSDGPLMLTFNTNESSPSDFPITSWSGSENTNHFFSHQDIFSQMPPSFRTNLLNIGTNSDSYNAYTFYRMLAQLGTDSTVENSKININFKNTDINGNIVPGMETNLIAWTALDFFTNAAAAMFRQMDLRDFNGNLVTVTNIPIYEDLALSGRTNNLNYYTPAVHRVLQMAANMYDATTNRFIGGGPTNYPSVFRPIFRSVGGVASIAGYVEVADTTDAFLPVLDPQTFATVNQFNTGVNLYGVPWVIGVKKGLPNFNEFSMENALQVTRKLEFTNNTAGKTTPPWQTNQIFDLAITNTFGMEAWKSYTNDYGRPLRMIASNELSLTITNETGFSLLTVSNLPFGRDINPVNGWTRWTEQLSDTSFVVPLQVQTNFAEGIYGKTFFAPVDPPRWTATFVPRLFMALQSKIRYVLIDTTANRVIDFVNIVKTEPVIDVGATLQNGYSGTFPDDANVDAMWDMRLKNGIQIGILNQIEISKNSASPVWTDPSRFARAITFNNNLLGNTGTNHFQAPYGPPRAIYQYVSLEANDPLVHYTAPDMTSTNGGKQAVYNMVQINNPLIPPLTTIGSVNFSDQPWGGRHIPGGSDLNPNPFKFDWRVKDAMVEQSDNWDFPTNKLPNIGWLGRVHRGTAWQTVYMKSSDLLPGDWTKWSNDNVLLTNGNDVTVDGNMSQPTDDYRLFDVFTTAINDNASRGQLNVNQTNLAAWSAVLSGVNVLTNFNGVSVTNLVINPAGVYDSTDTNNLPAVAAIVQGINATRANTNDAKGALKVFQNNVFQHAGDVLATPQLSIKSPFLNTTNWPNKNANGNAAAGGISDEVMERIPQQIMSLLTLNQAPRFVIYSFGQTLHPADHSLVIGGTFNNLCTNYQITAESAVRAVVRVEGTADSKFVGGKVDSLGRSYPPHLVVEQFNVLGPD